MANPLKSNHSRSPPPYHLVRLLNWRFNWRFNIQSSNGVVAHHLENEVQSAISTGSTEQNNDEEQEVELEEEIEEGDADEDDVSPIKKQKL